MVSRSVRTLLYSSKFWPRKLAPPCRSLNEKLIHLPFSLSCFLAVTFDLRFHWFPDTRGFSWLIDKISMVHISFKSGMQSKRTYIIIANYSEHGKTSSFKTIILKLGKVNCLTILICHVNTVHKYIKYQCGKQIMKRITSFINNNNNNKYNKYNDIKMYSPW